MSVHHKEWVKKVLCNLARKGLLVTELSLESLGQFSSGTFFVPTSTIKFLYGNSDMFDGVTDLIESDLDLYEETDCDTLLCHANTWSADHEMPEVSASQILGDEPLPEEKIE